MTQVTRIIDGISNQQHDYDYSQAMLYLCAGIGGVLFSHPTNKTEFDFSGSNITPGIALITCTRATSSPIPNQKFLAVFYSDANVPVLLAPNRKYYIEIDQSKINDPALIQDTGGSTSYLQGLNIGEIKVGTSRPAHTNYIKLWSTDGSSNKIDERVRYTIDANTINWGNILRNIVVHGSIDADAISTTDFMADGLVQLPTDTMFGAYTIQDLVESYIAGGLLSEFKATTGEVAGRTQDGKFATPLGIAQHYGFEPAQNGATGTVGVIVGYVTSSIFKSSTVRSMVRSIPIKRSGFYKFTWDLIAARSGSTTTARGRIYKAGVAYGPDNPVNLNGNSATQSNIVFFNAGEVAQLYIVGGPSGSQIGNSFFQVETAIQIAGLSDTITSY